MCSILPSNRPASTSVSGPHWITNAAFDCHRSIKKRRITAVRIVGHNAAVTFRLRSLDAVGNDTHIVFDGFSLDLANECLWKGSQAVKLRPKAFAVLEYLVSHPGRLVTKETLLNAAWPATFVGEAVLKVAIRQIREALADDPKAPRFIETAHRRGYRFIASLSASRGAAVAETRAVGEAARQRSGPADLPAAIVGREAAMAELQALFARARTGSGQMVFVTGEAGLGKTTLLDAFASSVAADPSVRLCSGQCLAQYGMSEPYLPVLDAIRQLCRNDSLAVDVLRRHA